MEKQGIFFFKPLYVSIFLIMLCAFSLPCFSFQLHATPCPPEPARSLPRDFSKEDSLKKDGKRDEGRIGKRDKLPNNKKKITFETFEKNYARAMRFYKNQQYISAARIFEELYPLTLGTPYADTILFTFANCYYLNRDYELAAFHFKDYSRRYAGMPKAEEAYFLCIKSIYNLSPPYSLDQFETGYAIEEIGYFFEQYPNSPYSEECNKILDLLREKLARKDFEVAKLYFYTENYPAVQIYVKNFMKEHPSSELMEEAVYLLVRNNFDYARRSVEEKQMERYLQCVDAFVMLKNNYPASSFMEQAAKYSANAEKAIEKLTAKK